MMIFEQTLKTQNLPSVLWHCWLDVRKSIRPVKSWMVRRWQGCLSGF